jgi:hypothetical protein
MSQTKPPPNDLKPPRKSLDADATADNTPVLPEPGATPIYKSEKEAISHSADPLPPAPPTRDPACTAAKQHQANCGCTGELRGPIAA